MNLKEKFLKSKNVESSEIKSEKKASEGNKSFEPLLFFFVIVNYGQGDAIVKLLQDIGSSFQIVHIGEGTATRQVASILGIEDNRKEIVISIIKESLVEDVKKELEAFFASNKKNRGIGFSVKMTSIVGRNMYHFLTNTL